MTLTLPAYEFPREMPLRGGSHPFESGTFEPVYTQGQAPTRGGRVQVANLGPSLWQMEFTSHVMGEQEAQGYLAWLQSLRGGARLFKAWHPLCEYPQEYPGGWGSMVHAGGSTPFSGSAVLASISTGRDEIGVTDLPASFKLVPGDMLSIPMASSGRTLHRVMEAVTASGAGGATIRVEPAIPLSMTVGDPAQAVLFHKPWCLAVVDASSISGPWSAGRFGRVSFSAVQTF